MFFSKEQPTGLIFNPEQDNDPRNLRWGDIMPLAGQNVPKEGDVEIGDWRLNQVRTTACTCHSTVYLYNQEKNVRLSPRFAFYKIKTDKKYPSSTLPHGAYMVDSLKLLVNEGICGYNFYPNEYTGSDEDYLHFPPSQLAEYDAANHKGGTYFYVTSGGSDEEKFDAIVSYLATSGKPCKVGMTWWKEYNNARNTGIVPNTKPSGTKTGHDMMAVAWREINGIPYLGFANSFGPTWGDRGRIWLPRGFNIQSAIGYLNNEETQQTGVQKPTEAIENRDVYLEKSKALALRNDIYAKLPLNVNEGAQNANNKARGIAGRMWLVLVQAVTYRKFTNTDVINFLYAQSREKKNTKAYSFDFTHNKK